MECCICYETPETITAMYAESFIKIPCDGKHVVCFTCFMRNESKTCPMCRHNYAEEHTPRINLDYYDDEDQQYVDEIAEQQERDRNIHRSLAFWFAGHHEKLAVSRAIWTEHKERNKEQIIQWFQDMYGAGEDRHFPDYSDYKKEVGDMCSIIRRTFEEMNGVDDIFRQLESAYGMARAIYVAELSTHVERGTYEEFIVSANKFINHEEFVEYDMDNWM
jgi:hypothetical protein